MPPRLLAFLSAVEHALVANGFSGVQEPPSRSVNYQKSIARMTFHDGSGSLTLQNFTLADGEICVKAEFYWSKTHAWGNQSVFPKTEDFDWVQAAEKISEGWLAGLPQAEAMAFGGTEVLSAAG